MFVHILLFLLVNSCIAEEEDNRHYEIFTLSKQFYGSFIDSEEIVLVKYYAPWCQHCQELKPLFEELAKTMYGKVKFAEINCDESAEICESEGIQGYPTLALFRKDRQKKIYGGERSVEAMKKWIESLNVPAMTEIKESDVEGLKKSGKSFVLVRSEADDAIRTQLLSVVDSIEYLNIYAIDKEMDGFTLEVFNGDSNETKVYEGEFDENKFVIFANMYTFPEFHQVTVPLFRRVDKLPNHYVLWYFYENQLSNVTISMMRKLAKEYKEKVLFMSFNKIISKDQVQHMFHTGEKYPVITMIHSNKRNMYAMDESIELNEETIKKFIDEVVNNKVKPNMRVSKKLDDKEQKATKRINGEELQELEKGNGKDNLVLFCIEKSEPCQFLLEQALPNITKIMKDVKTFQIQWLDLILDDVSEEWIIDSMPKIFLLSDRDGKKTRVGMTELPSEQAILDFINKNALYKEHFPEMKVPEEPKKEL